MKRKMMSLITLMLVLCLVFSTTAMATATPVDLSTQPEVTLTYYGTDPSIVAGIQKNAIFDEIYNQLKIRVNYVTLDPTQMQAALASGDLPDIMQVPVYDTDGKPGIAKYIMAKALQPMDELLTQYGPDITANCPQMLSFVKKYNSNDTGLLYGLTGNNFVNFTNSPQKNYPIGLNIRWDYYKELGYPEIKTTDDFINVLLKMKEAHPTTADGKPMYGMSAWTDWGLWPYYVPFSFGQGYMNGDNYIFDAQGNIQPMFSENGGVFKDAMKFLYKMTKAGLADPEMFTQKNTDFIAKNKNLQLLSVPSTWWEGEAQITMNEQGIKNGGYYIIPGTTPVTWTGYGSDIAGNLADRLYVITTKCKNPDRAMQLLNFMFSFKGNTLLRNGLQGQHWDVVDGKYEITDATREASKTDATFAQTTGIGLYGNMCGLSGDSKDDQGNFLSLSLTDKSMAAGTTDADKDYSAHYNVSYPAQAFAEAEKQGLTKLERFDTTWQSLLPPVTDDMKLISGQVGNYALPFVATLASAQSDEEFESIWTNGVKELNGMGYEKLMQFYIDNAAKCVAEVKNIK